MKTVAMKEQRPMEQSICLWDRVVFIVLCTKLLFQEAFTPPVILGSDSVELADTGAGSYSIIQPALFVPGAKDFLLFLWCCTLSGACKLQFICREIFCIWHRGENVSIAEGGRLKSGPKATFRVVCWSDVCLLCLSYGFFSMLRWLLPTAAVMTMSTPRSELHYTLYNRGDQKTKAKCGRRKCKLFCSTEEWCTSKLNPPFFLCVETCTVALEKLLKTLLKENMVLHRNWA